MNRAQLDNDPALNAQEALLDTLNEWAGTMTHAERCQIAYAVTRILTPRAGWPIQRVDMGQDFAERN